MLKLKLRQASLVELFIVAVFSALLIANAWGTFFASEDVIMPIVISVLIAMAFIFLFAQHCNVMHLNTLEHLCIRFQKQPVRRSTCAACSA